jgi:hypothetical protein
MEKLTETLESGRLIVEAARQPKTPNALMKFRAPALKLDTPTSNKRLYKTEAVKKAVEKLMAKDNSIFGANYHPEHMELNDVSHILTKLEVDEKSGFLMAEGEVLNTARGRDLKVVLDAGAKVGLSIRGRGDVDKEGVVENFELFGVDAVLNPASPNCHLHKGAMFESADLTDESDLDISALSAELDERLVEEARLSGCKKTKAEILRAIRGK